MAKTDLTTGDNYYYHQDALGSVTARTDETGGVVETYKYTTFGEPTIYDKEGLEISESQINNFFNFTGREWDGETGLYYYRARYYDAELGRFLSRDPLGILNQIPQLIGCSKDKIEMGDGPNLYAYVKNNPINLVDPFGLSCGPGGVGNAVIPDAPFGVNFNPACSFHDDCWGTCHEDRGKSLGEWFSYCNTRFLILMIRQCMRYATRVDFNTCQETAFIYYRSVSDALGRWIYNRAQKKACKCEKP